MSTTSKVYFPGLNGLRFIAASAVIITHIELIKGVFGFENHWNEPLFFNLGGLGVYFFFVLSGFLITYLLLKEKEVTGNIKIKDFYIRRILRIWPLYYLILIIGFFILPHFSGIHISYLQQNFTDNYFSNFMMYLLILPNLAFSIYTAVPHIGQSWSIGVEEQFYIFWPWLIKKSKNVVFSLMVFILIMVFVKVAVLFLPLFMREQYWYVLLKRFLAMTKLESMAIGGIGAYILFNKKKIWLNLIYNKSILWIALLAIPLLIYFTPDFLQDGIHLVYSIIFLIIIINVSSNKNNSIGLENKIFRFLGNISYGIYMYHLMIIPIVLFFYKKLNLRFGEVPEILIIYFLVFIITIAISALSYYFFEEKFIKLKSKFTTIKSGQENVK